MRRDGIAIDLREALLQLLLLGLRKRRRRGCNKQGGDHKITHDRSIPALAPEAQGLYGLHQRQGNTMAGMQFFAFGFGYVTAETARQLSADGIASSGTVRSEAATRPGASKATTVSGTLGM